MLFTIEFVKAQFDMVLKKLHLTKRYLYSVHSFQIEYYYTKEGLFEIIFRKKYYFKFTKWQYYVHASNDASELNSLLEGPSKLPQYYQAIFPDN